MAYTYDPAYASGSTTPEAAQKVGLGTGQNILADQVAKKYDYPDDISGQMTGPATADYATQAQNTPMAQYEMGSLTGGDYDTLQSNLQAPIYQQGQEQQANIANTYGGNGLYGSVGGGLMSGAQADSQQATQNALSNAVGQRYNLQLAEQEALANYNLDQNKSLYASGAANTDQLNKQALEEMGYNKAQDQAGIDFGNQQLANKQQYQMSRNAFDQSVDDRNYQNALALAGLAQPAVASNQGYSSNQASIAAQRAQADAAQQAALYGGLGQLAGGLMGSYGDKGWTFGGIGDTIGSWF